MIPVRYQLSRSMCTHYLFPSAVDMIAIPDFSSGAMENWGLITYRETALLYEEGVSSESNKERIAVVVSHELAHQVRWNKANKQTNKEQRG